MLHKREGESAAMFFIRWTGRLLSLATGLLLALFFLGEGLHFSELAALELIGLLFFPFGLLIGFAVGWHNELAGGGISVVSVAAFYLIYGMVANGSLPSGFFFCIIYSSRLAISSLWPDRPYRSPSSPIWASHILTTWGS
ncbi:MAG: hypothetical protein IPK01_02895 [Acidobacteria bacterium]|nr:hypothetical protein [Acidobacteriota bacterium]